MRVVAIAMVKSEADIVEAFVRHTLVYVHHLAILDNGSSDDTSAILEALKSEGLPVSILNDPSAGKYHSERMTRLMREQAAERLGADWVLPLDVDEFVAAPSRDDLVHNHFGPDQPIVLPWQTYVPDESDDPQELNPVLRMRHHLIQGCRAVNVMVPRKLAVLPDAVLLRGNHELTIGGKPSPAAGHESAYLAHFPVRSAGQYLAKIVIAALQNEVVTDRSPEAGWHYRSPYELAKRDPRAFLAGFAAAAQRYLMLPGEKVEADGGSSPVVETPFPYCGGPLRYTKSIDDGARASRAILSYMEDLARRFGILSKSLSEQSLVSLDMTADLIAKVRFQMDALVDRGMLQEVQLVEKERVIQDLAQALAAKESNVESLVGSETVMKELAAKERVIQELATAVKQIPIDIKRSWTWRIGRFIVGPLSKLGNQRRKKVPTGVGQVHMEEKPRSGRLALIPPLSALDGLARPAETAIKELYDSLSTSQKSQICFDWGYRDPQHGILQSFVANHWQITKWPIRSSFFTNSQQSLIHEIFKSIVNPNWYSKFLKQLWDDNGGHPWGADQSIAIFGTPGSDKFQFVITGRHLTLRADGNSDGRVAFGGPIFYGHAASGFWESARHPGNVFWPQAQHAGKVYEMLNGRQRRLALVDHRPDEPGIAFPRLHQCHPGIPVTEMTQDQKLALRHVLQMLIDPFRESDQQRVMQCLQTMGGLDQCTLAFYSDCHIAGQEEWDNWRLTGPAFAWFFRGTPHVHVWVHVATDPSMTPNAKKGVFLHAAKGDLEQKRAAA